MDPATVGSHISRTYAINVLTNIAVIYLNWSRSVDVTVLDSPSSLPVPAVASSRASSHTMASDMPSLPGLFDDPTPGEDALDELDTSTYYEEQGEQPNES